MVFWFFRWSSWSIWSLREYFPKIQPNQWYLGAGTLKYMHYFEIGLNSTWNRIKIFIFPEKWKQSMNSIICFDSCPQCQLPKRWVVWYQWRGRCMQWEEYYRTPTPPENLCPTISKETLGPCCLKWKKSDMIPVSQKKKNKPNIGNDHKIQYVYALMRSGIAKHINSCQFPKVWFCILRIIW